MSEKNAMYRRAAVPCRLGAALLCGGMAMAVAAGEWLIPSPADGNEAAVAFSDCVALAAGEGPKFNAGHFADYPYYMPRHTSKAVDAGVALVKRGGYIDCTAGSDDVAVKEDAMKLFDLLHREGVNPDHVSLSSDAYGSQPRFNEAGECVGLTYASPKYLHKTIQALVRMGMPLAQALKLLTTTPATLLAQDGRKGCIDAGADADLLVLDADLEIDSLFARGQLALWQKDIRMKGRFEE